MTNKQNWTIVQNYVRIEKWSMQKNIEIIDISDKFCRFFKYKYCNIYVCLYFTDDIILPVISYVLYKNVVILYF